MLDRLEKFGLERRHLHVQQTNVVPVDEQDTGFRERHRQAFPVGAVPAAAGHVVDDTCLGVVECLDFEQRVGASRFVLRTGLAQHEPLAADRLDEGELLVKMIQAGTAQLRQHAGKLRRLFSERGVQPCRAGFKRRCDRWRVKYNEPDLTPRWRFVMPADDAHGLLERFAIQPQFAVQQ